MTRRHDAGGRAKFGRGIDHAPYLFLNGVELSRRRFDHIKIRST